MHACFCTLCGTLQRREEMSKLAAKSSLNRESLYKMLSKRGNPSLQSLGPSWTALAFGWRWNPRTPRER
jgi:DNA-binding phage protein